MRAGAQPRIFVAVAAYRDPECAPTLRDLFEQAARPDLLSVGVCWQLVPGEDDGLRGTPPDPRRVREIIVDAREARGACWAKRRALDLRDDAPLVLHIDSHMRFHRGWDDTMRRMLAACPSSRALLSTYPAPYEPPRTALRCQTPRMLPKGFDADGVLTLRAEDARLATPELGAFLAGGFIFSSAAFWDEVPYDPRLYFTGEEVTLAARAYTHGWDIYAPPTCAVHHYYRRQGAKHWEDDPTWGRRHARSVARVRHLLGTESCTDAEALEGLAEVGLGGARPLEGFERLAGVDFRRRLVTPRSAL